MEDLVVGDLVIPASDLIETFDTSGGPGGQHANRTKSAVRLRLDLDSSSMPTSHKELLNQRFGSVIEVTASDHRSQLQNRREARERLSAKISKALIEPTPRKPTKPTKTSTQKRKRDKKARSELKRSRRRPTADE